MTLRPALAAALAMTVAAPAALAQEGADRLPASASTTDQTPAALTGVDVVEHLGDKVPGDLTFTDSQGRAFKLADRLGRGRPVVLALVYYDCPMLCSLLLTGVVTGMKGTGLELGRDFDALTVSFNPRETFAQAAEKQGHYLQALGKPTGADDWVFAVGQEPDVRGLAQAVGFQYKRDEKTGQYAHLAAIYVLTPQGVISRYLYGVTFDPRDLKLAIMEAGQGRVGSTLERLLLTCYRYDPAKRKYAFFLNTTLRTGGLLILAGVTTLLVQLWRRERRRGAAA